MKTAGVYVSCGNLFWANVRAMTSAKVPINAASLEKIQKTFFQQGPEKLGLEVVVGVPKNCDAEKFISLHGNLLRISPEEIDHALVLHVSARITAGASEEELLQLACVYDAMKFLRFS